MIKIKFSFILLVVFSLCTFSCKSQTQQSRIEIVPASIELEATSIWQSINNIIFFEKQAYTVNLPEGSLIDSLLIKSKLGNFGNEDYQRIYSFLEAKVFKQSNYEKAKLKLENQIDFINDLISEIDSKKHLWDWEFKTFDRYKVVFTLYGTGGSYDPNTGVINVLTNKEGEFMNYKNPANTIIHEITHIGMEQSIIRKYNLPHGLKERLVDSFVSLMFREKLPEYKIQNMGDIRIDDYLKKQEDLNSLNAIISEFVN